MKIIMLFFKSLNISFLNILCFGHVHREFRGVTRTYMERKGSFPPLFPILMLIGVQSELDVSLLKDTEVSNNVISIEWNNLILDVRNMLGLSVSSPRSHDLRFYLTTDNVILPNDFGWGVQELPLQFQAKSTCFLETQLKLLGYVTAEWSSKEGGKRTDGKRQYSIVALSKARLWAHCYIFGFTPSGCQQMVLFICDHFFVTTLSHMLIFLLQYLKQNNFHETF